MFLFWVAMEHRENSVVARAVGNGLLCCNVIFSPGPTDDDPGEPGGAITVRKVTSGTTRMAYFQSSF